MAAVENTGGGEGNIDPSTNFTEWLQSKGAKQELIDKMLAMDMDSIDVLREIDLDDPEAIKQISKELNLNYSQTCKFKAIIRSISNSKLNVIVDPDERKAILQMKDKLKQIQLSITNIDECKKNIQNEVQRCTKLISITYDNIAQTASKRKEMLLVELKSIVDDKINELNKTYEIMKKNSISTSLKIDTCYGKINKKIDLMHVEERKRNILKISKIVYNLDIIGKDDNLVDACNINFVCNSNKAINDINNSGHFASVSIPSLSKKCMFYQSHGPKTRLSTPAMTTTVSDIEDKLKQLKLQGNTHFKKKNYKTAIKWYTKAIDDKIYEGNISDITPLIELRQSLLLNRAKSHFQLNHLKDALIDSSNCIKTHNGTKLSYKAHYTRAEIYQSLGDFKNAIKHCDRILNEKNPTLGMSELQNRTKKFKKHIKEKSSKKSKHRSHRPNNIIETTEVETTELKKKVLSLEKALISVRDERDQIQQQTVEQKLQINAIEHEKQQLQTQTDRLRKMNLSNLSEIKSLQQQNNELLDDKKEYELKINELMDEISKLQRIDETMYENWSHKEILAWIVSLDNGRFEKYEDELLRNLREEEIQGNDLNGVNEIDLKSWGVKNFKDKKLLLTKIKELTEQNNFNVNNINEEGVATAII
eukprot:250550_1